MNRMTQPLSQTGAVGQLLRHHRLERRLTQTELARQIGIQQSDLSRMEKGEYRVSLDVLFRLLRVFEMSLGEFFGDLASQSLTARETHLLESFRALPREVQEEVLEFAEFKRTKRRERDE
jgi:transcriptional regulator with XRE-family HTH domain